MPFEGSSPEGATYEHVGEPDPETCLFAGHEWAPMGGALLICMVCEREKWEDDDAC